MKKQLLRTIGIALVVGLLLSIGIFNFLERKTEQHLEVTFIDARKALIFWKTPQPSIGFVTYGDNRYFLKNTEYQTSSEPSEIHAVLLEKIPVEGLFISLHTTGDSRLYLPKVEHIQYKLIEDNGS